MDNHELEEALERQNKLNPPQQQYKLIGENDTFEFECQRCGACCMNREDIIINAWDVYNASKALGITTKEFIDKYTTQSLGGFSKLPLITIGHMDSGACHFLKFDYMNSGKYVCTINDHKPGACAGHPLGILTRYDKESISTDNHFIRVEQCESSKKPVTQNVKDWMRHYLNHQEEFKAAHAFIAMYSNHENFRKWYFLATLFMGMAANRGYNASEDPVVKAFAASCDLIINYTYINYDISQPFVPQAEANLKLLDECLTKSDEVIKNVEMSTDKMFSTGSECPMTVQEIIENNDREGGLNLDIGQLAVQLSSNIRFSDDKGGKE